MTTHTRNLLVTTGLSLVLSGILTLWPVSGRGAEPVAVGAAGPTMPSSRVLREDAGTIEVLYTLPPLKTTATALAAAVGGADADAAPAGWAAARQGVLAALTQAAAGRQPVELRLGNTPVTGGSGQPRLPVVPVQLVLPAGREFERVEVLGGRKVTLAGSYFVLPGQPPLPLLPEAEPTFAPPDPAIYGAAVAYPATRCATPNVQRRRGVGYVLVNLNPVEYVPASGQLSYYETLTVKLTTKAATGAPALRYRPDPVRPLDKGAANPAALKTYALTAPAGTPGVLGLCDPAQSFQYVVVTSDAIRNATTVPNVNDLLAQKRAAGLSCTVVSIESILAAYSGVDDAEKLRHFIRDAYTNWETDFVLLGGDTNIIPLRKLTTNGEGIPSDLYYQCLDGSYDGDGNGVWGEATDGPDGTDVDLLAEVYVGRAAAENADEFANFVAKTLAYENDSDAADYLRRALIAGEYLGGNFGPGIFGYAVPYMEEIRLGAATSGYTTVGFAAFPAIGVDRLYDYPAGWEGNASAYTWTKAEMLAKLNSNTYSLINHLGHANADYVMRFYNADADALTNDKSFFLHSQGCIPGNFEVDCMAEHLTTSNRHGAFAAVLNARYGYGAYNTAVETMDGPSQRIQRQFWNAYFGEFIFNLGILNADSHEGNIWCINNKYLRWCVYETNLFGDPHTPLRGQSPEPRVTYLAVTVNDGAPHGNGDGIVNPGENPTLLVTLRNAGLNPAAGVNATLATTDAYVTVTDNSAAFGDMAGAGAAKPASDPFGIAVAADCPTPHAVTFDLNLTSASGGPWTASFTVMVYTSSQIAGRVLTATGGDGIAGATVSYSGPVAGTLSTAADGSYTIAKAIDGSYTLVARAIGYLDSEPVTVTVPPSPPAVNLALDTVKLGVAPGALSGTAAEGDSCAATLTVSNQGEVPLTWSLWTETPAPTGTAGKLARGAVVRQFGTPTEVGSPKGLAFDGMVLWVSNGGTTLFALDPADGRLLGARDVSAPCRSAASLAWDGTHLWIHDTASTMLNAVDRNSGAVARRFAVSSTALGLACGDDALWVLDSSTTPRTICRLNPTDGALIAAFSVPAAVGSDVADLTYFNGALCLSSGGTVFKLSPADGSVLAQFPGPATGIVGTADDFNQYLWLASVTKYAKMLYLVDTGETAWLSATPTSGAVAPGATQTVTATLNARVLAAGTHTGKVVFRSNDEKGTPTRDVPVTFTVTAGSRLAYAAQTCDDDGTAPSAGNGDGVAEPGETIELGIAIVNTGHLPATSLAGVLSTTDPYVTIRAASQTFPAAAVGATVTSNGPFVVQLAASCPAIHHAYFALTVSDDAGRQWPLVFALGVRMHANIAVTPVSLAQTLPPGNLASQPLTLSNSGTLGLDWTAAPVLSGFTVTDSDQAGGPAYAWVEIAGSGTPIAGLGSEGNVGPFDIGFNFPFYGNSFSSFRVCDNGWLSFTSNAMSWANTALPSSSAPENLVAFCWDNLNLTDSGSAWYQLVAADTLVVEFKDVPFISGPGTLTCEAVLKSDGTIVWQYQTIGQTESCTVGVQNAERTRGCQVVYNAAYLHNGLAVRLAPLADWLTVSPTAGTVVPAGSTTLTATFDATGLAAGHYSARLQLKSNALGVPVLEVPVTLTVSAASNQPPQIVSPAWADADPVTLPNGTTAHVVASDPDGDALTYAWSKVSGTGTPTFAAPTAADSGITFSAAGTYVLRVTVADGKGGSVSSDVSVTVNPGSGVDPRADVNHDGVVNALDLQIVIANFGQTVGSPGCDARADANGDGVVNAMDLQIVIANFGKTVP